MNRLYILMGIPGTGKSTWAKRFFDPWQIVSSDAIRIEFAVRDGEAVSHSYPDELAREASAAYNAAKNGEVFTEFHYRIDQLLAEDEDAVADATSLTYRAREQLHTMAKYHHAEIHLVVFTATAQGFENNPKRGAMVPETAMEEMLAKYHSAIVEIRDEPYDSITFISGVAEPNLLAQQLAKQRG